MDREIIEREEKIKRLCEKAEKVVEGKNSELANKVRLMMSWFKTSYNKIYDYIDEVLEHPKDASEGFFLVAEIFEGFVNHGLNEFERMIQLLESDKTDV
jgi:hypothetical protein